DALEVAAPVLSGSPPRPSRFMPWVRMTTLAASMAAAFLLVSRKPEKRVVPTPPPVAAPPAPRAAQPPVTLKPAIIRRLRPRKQATPPKKTEQLEYFLALDDEPVETGIVVRVALDNGRVPADVIVGTDGHPHAIRLVSTGVEHERSDHY